MVGAKEKGTFVNVKGCWVVEPFSQGYVFMKRKVKKRPLRQRPTGEVVRRVEEDITGGGGGADKPAKNKV